jgi:hypothetical protein
MPRVPGERQHVEHPDAWSRLVPVLQAGTSPTRTHQAAPQVCAGWNLMIAIL